MPVRMLHWYCTTVPTVHTLLWLVSTATRSHRDQPLKKVFSLGYQRHGTVNPYYVYVRCTPYILVLAALLHSDASTYAPLVLYHSTNGAYTAMASIDGYT